MTPEYLDLVAAAYQQSAENYERNGIVITRVRGGANNAMYRVSAGGEDYAVKLCVKDERQRARREFNALTFLRAANIDLAPEPILLDESCDHVPFPLVIYRWVWGESLSLPLNDEQLRWILTATHAIQCVSREKFSNAKLDDAWFHWFAFEPYLSELRNFQKQYGNWLGAQNAEGRQLAARAERLVESCIKVVSASRVDPSREKIALRLAHVDWNLANVIQSPGGLSWVDWEFSGWGDPALELADLRWHIALDGLTEGQHRFLRENYHCPAGEANFEKRVAIWDAILATRWVFLIARNLWSVHNGPDRVRLTMPKQDSKFIQAQLLRTIERAEQFL